VEVSAVKLRNSYQISYVDTNSLFVGQHALCIVETEHGIDIGNVVKCRRYQNNPDIEVKGKLLRLTTHDDLNLIPEIESIEKKAFTKCRDKAKNKNLDMKLISVKCLFDKTKIIFYFVSENRIDFRELVRELASVFRTRIEMRQIGVRDEARLVGGYGPCGMELCCVHQKDEFDPVSIKMAKEQNLNLNSMKISGMCGRLLCCLGYEYELYREFNKGIPGIGTEIMADNKKCSVCGIDTIKEKIQIRDGNRFIEISKHDLESVKDRYRIKREAMEKISQSEEDTNDDNTFNK
jgi:cell fate regulator YaaT (PSP1 superfamily)